MKTEKPKSVIAINSGKNLKIAEKKNILIIDPCYIFDHTIPELDAAWQELCRLMFADSNSGLSSCGIMTYNGAIMLYGGTAHGDGCYEVTSNMKQQGSECGVDAGTLCFISVEDVLKINPKFNDWKLGVIFPDFSGNLETDGDGIFSGSNGIECDTKGKEEPTCENCGEELDYEGASCEHCGNEEE